MTNGSVAFLVDTNVLVYAYDRGDTAKWQRAQTVLDYLAASGTGAISVQILGEFFVTVTRKISSPLTLAAAERSITHYARSWTVFDLTPLVVLEAVQGLQRYSLSYWDSLIWATAKLHRLPYVLSEDFSDGALLENVRFLNPFAASFDLALIPAPR